MRKIPLHGKHGEGKFALVDDEDFESVSQYRWLLDNKGYVRATISTYRVVGLHQFIMKPPRGMMVDHVHGNPLDNRRSELRVCTRSENNRNKRKHRNNTSGYKGVSFNKDSGKWAATITFNSRNIQLGFYVSPEDAARAYDEAAIKYHGEFAHPN